MINYVARTKFKILDKNLLQITDIQSSKPNEFNIDALLEDRYKMSFKCHIAKDRIIILHAHLDESKLLDIPKLVRDDLSKRLSEVFLENVELTTSYTLTR